ncbi:MAG TPA: wax ester/triacylglycerol synthase domain-containing protein, partial [Burkholderiaceae bacterium]|nr:wax ester/triacylglycerol synthase domain-containing protein [Burkholderiaceae bacterium]
MDHLSSMDASFLHFETPETPMHVASLSLLSLPEGYKGDYFEDVKAMIGKRMHLATVLTRKLAQMPFELAEPVWIDDDDIDLDYHVRSLTLRRPGTMEQLEALVARLHSTLLDRSRPLWEMYVIEGLQDGQVAFYSKAHHSGVDGKAGTEMAKVLYDISPQMREVTPPRRKNAQGSSGYQLGVAELLQAAVSNSAAQYRKLAALLPTAAKALTAAGKVLASQRTAKGERPLNLG